MPSVARSFCDGRVSIIYHVRWRSDSSHSKQSNHLPAVPVRSKSARSRDPSTSTCLYEWWRRTVDWCWDVPAVPRYVGMIAHQLPATHATFHHRHSHPSICTLHTHDMSSITGNLLCCGLTWTGNSGWLGILHLVSEARDKQWLTSIMKLHSRTWMQMQLMTDLVTVL